MLRNETIVTRPEMSGFLASIITLTTRLPLVCDLIVISKGARLIKHLKPF
jgi:hypothetical protein